MSSVSVFVPAHNYGRFLPDAVGSVLSQQGVDVRVLVLDDASQDDTPDIAAALVRADPRVAYVRHDRNRGHLATYNEGVDWADGDYTVLLSADDLLAPGALRRAADVLDRDPRVAFVYGGVCRIRPGAPMPAPRTPAAGVDVRTWPGQAWVQRVCRAGRNPVVAPEVVVRTAMHRRVGGYDLRLPHSADLELWLRLAAVGDVAWITNADQAFYRLHDANMHETRFAGLAVRVAHRRAAFDVFFDGPLAARLPERDRLRALADEALARELLARARDALDAGRDEVQGSHVEELVTLAAELTDVTRLRGYRTLQWRIRLGPRAAGRLGPVVRAATLRHPRAWLRWRLAHRRTA